MDVVDGLHRLADVKGVTVGQLALASVIRDPVISCALVGPRRPDQTEEAIAATPIEFTPEEIIAMDRLVDRNGSPDDAFDP